MTYIVIVWALVFAFLLWLLARHADIEQATPAAPPDPYEGELIQWRRQVHDWTRDN